MIINISDIFYFSSTIPKSKSGEILNKDLEIFKEEDTKKIYDKFIKKKQTTNSLSR